MINLPTDQVNNKQSFQKKFFCPCNNLQTKGTFIECKKCNTVQHENCIKGLTISDKYECPYCQIKEMDPFIKTLSNVHPPVLIKFSNSEVKGGFDFSIRPELSKFAEDYTKDLSSKDSSFIMLRCLRLDEEGYEHHWPLNFSLVMNGHPLKNLILPKFPPRSRSRIDHPLSFYFRLEDANQINNYHALNKEHFYSIQKNINLNGSKPNSLEFKSDFTKNDTDKFSYVLSLDLVRVMRTCEDVIMTIPEIKETQTLMTYFNKVYDGIIFNEKINLIDCYTRAKRINIPARSFNCSHLSVFDLKYFLTINRKSKAYNCPLCMKKANGLYVDGYIKKFLEENSNLDEFLMSLNYEVLNSKSEKASLDKIKINNSKPEKENHVQKKVENVNKNNLVISLDVQMDPDQENGGSNNNEGSNLVMVIPDTGFNTNQNEPTNEEKNTSNPQVNFNQNKEGSNLNRSQSEAITAENIREILPGSVNDVECSTGKSLNPQIINSQQSNENGIMLVDEIQPTAQDNLTNVNNDNQSSSPMLLDEVQISEIDEIAQRDKNNPPQNELLLNEKEKNPTDKSKKDKFSAPENNVSLVESNQESFCKIRNSQILNLEDNVDMTDEIIRSIEEHDKRIIHLKSKSKLEEFRDIFNKNLLPHFRFFKNENIFDSYLKPKN